MEQDNKTIYKPKKDTSRLAEIVNTHILHKDKILAECGMNKRECLINGGIMLFNPSMDTFNVLKNNMKLIIHKNCKYPNETLFLYTNIDLIYNMPVRYNFSHYHFKKYEKVKNKYVIHFIKT